MTIEHRRLLERNETRLDGLLDQQREIVNSHLGLGQVSNQTGTIPKPISVRKPWKSVQADFERKDREAHWRDKIAEVEKHDATAMNKVVDKEDPEVAQDLEDLKDGSDSGSR